MQSITFNAVFEPCPDGYGVYWPDLPGCTSFGSDFADAARMSRRALALHLYGLRQDGEPAPAPSEPPYADLPPDGLIVPITVFPELITVMQEKRAVRTNVTIPAWLKEWAQAQNLNLSLTLETTLSEMYHQAV